MPERVTADSDKDLGKRLRERVVHAGEVFALDGVKTCVGLRHEAADRIEELGAALSASEGRCDALREAAAGVLKGFNDGVFVRDVSRDHESAWAIRAMPYLRDVGRLQTLVDAGLAPPTPEVP